MGEEGGGGARVRPVHLIGRSLADLQSFPDEAQRNIGFALWFAQRGDEHPTAKPLKGFGGSAALEIVEDFHGDTFRAVYTVRFAKAIYVLHAFQKKSKSGIKTPRHELATIEARLKWAELDYQRWVKDQVV